MGNMDYTKYSCGAHLLENELFLSRCQVDTPEKIASFLWEIVSSHRSELTDVVDLGAGNGRFAVHNKLRYRSYTGYEIDDSRIGEIPLPENAVIEERCAFEIGCRDYDLCIGNPPYVRHHDINTDCQEKISKQLEGTLGIKLKRTANLFVLFLVQGLAITKKDGLVAQIIPYEWVTRPSTKPIRELIRKNRWNVHVYRFVSKIFPRVLTTACITVIDKSKEDSIWKYNEVSENLLVTPVKRVTGSRYNVIEYSKRGESNFAQRGLSPGGNKVFCLTEGERLHHGLETGKDVFPCLTSLRPLPDHLRTLTIKAFNKNYVEAGQKCWLINNSATPSKALQGYLKRVAKELRDNHTCRNQNPWWGYKPHPAPEILYNPGFVKSSPQFIDNRIGAIAVSSVFGIHKLKGISRRKLIQELNSINFKKRLISYANVLRRVEVNQMNTVINEIIKRVAQENRGKTNGKA